jgi:hypothetical protein
MKKNNYIKTSLYKSYIDPSMYSIIQRFSSIMAIFLNIDLKKTRLEVKKPPACVAFWVKKLFPASYDCAVIA